MNALTPKQSLIQQAAKDFVAKNIIPHAVAFDKSENSTLICWKRQNLARSSPWQFPRSMAGWATMP